MSYHKDSSVARSRLKRPHRIPARFEDFSTLPTTHHISSPDLERSVSPPPELKAQKISAIEKVIKEKSASTSTSSNSNATTTDQVDTNVAKTPPPPPPPLQAKEQSLKKITKEPKETTKEDESPQTSEPMNVDHLKELTEREGENKASKSNDNSSKSNQRKKAKGYSLMVKKNPNNVLFQANTTNVNNSTSNTTSNATNCGNGEIINRLNPQLLIQQQQQQLQQQAPKFYASNLPQCVQYGTRLMINEPIYLPRNVATIAPITTTLQQMEEQVRKLPLISMKETPTFPSERSRRCIAYQEERKMNFMTSNFDALVKITSHLEVRDLLNLRLVNKSWKSIVDSDVVWKKVRLEKTKVKNCDELGRHLAKYKTTDLYLINLDLKVSWYRMFENLIRDDVDLRRIHIESSDGLLNRVVVELLCILNFNTKRLDTLKVNWKVKSNVNDSGIILVPFRTRKQKTILSDPKMNLYCYKNHPEWLNVDRKKNILIELSDITDLFNGGCGDICTTPCKLEITVEPV